MPLGVSPRILSYWVRSPGLCDLWVVSSNDGFKVGIDHSTIGSGSTGE